MESNNDLNITRRPESAGTGLHANWVKVFIRVALAAGFLSASADRFGLWPARMSVWGSWQKFEAYTGQLLFNAPTALVKPAAVIATAAEVILGIMLLAGIKLRLTALLSGILLLMFGLSMMIALGPKAPLDYSVFSAAAAAFALYALSPAGKRSIVG